MSDKDLLPEPALKEEDNSSHVPENDVEAPLIDHLRELRKRIMIVVSSILLAFIVCFLFAGNIYDFLVQPLADAYETPSERRLIFTGLTEMFFTQVKLAFFGAFIIAFPVIGSQLYKFAAPGLYKHERRVMLPFLIGGPVLFIIGAAMAYYFIFPLAWKFFLGFESLGENGALAIQLEARVSEYLSLVMRMIIAFGVGFQLPLLLLLLARVGLVTAEGLARKRKYALLGILVFAAVITPPDLISQIGLAFPLLFLYECSIISCRMTESKKRG